MTAVKTFQSVIERLEAERDTLLAQLPEGMKDCTIQFKECKKGHGWLTATNWVQHECPICERDTLRTFAKHVMESWPCGDVDGGDLQDKAVELGLLKLTEPIPHEPCGENCACNEYYSPEDFRDGKVMCYRKTVLLTGEKV